ncbi:uncharacterized protein LOC117115389, partial [Anneissia japonica]|uniref:uncharacterized protein LOC117115389 n=1 Tax=Anneissia japonica TaxID=1529436 RepID=UPI0014254FB4
MPIPESLSHSGVMNGNQCLLTTESAIWRRADTTVVLYSQQFSRYQRYQKYKIEHLHSKIGPGLFVEYGVASASSYRERELIRRATVVRQNTIDYNEYFYFSTLQVLAVFLIVCVLAECVFADALPDENELVEQRGIQQDIELVEQSRIRRDPGR